MWGIQHDSEVNTFNWINRLKSEHINIPKGVADQWLWNFHYDDEAFNQYNHIDLTKISFSLTELSTKDILNTHPGDYGREWTESVEKQLKSVNGNIFESCNGHIDEITGSWINFGTWRTPPIILDSDDFKEFQRPYLLMEGYTRLGFFRYYAKNINNLSKITLKPLHKVWLVNKLI